AYMGFKYGPEELAKRRLELRLREVSGVGEPREEGETTVLRREADGPLPTVERAVLKTRAGSQLALLIEQADVQTTPGAILLFSFGAAVGAALLTLLFVPYPIIALVVAPVAGSLPFAWLRWKRSSRLKKFEEQFP